MSSEILANDEKAANEFIRAELPRVYNFCWHIYGRRPEAEALCQEVFVRALRTTANLKDNPNWFYRLTLDLWKARRRFDKKAILKMTEPQPKPGVFDVSSLPKQWQDLNRNHQELLSILSTFDDEDRILIVLKDIEKKSYDEIAAILETTASNIKLRVSRARDLLRDTFHRKRGRLL